MIFQHIALLYATDSEKVYFSITIFFLNLPPLKKKNRKPDIKIMYIEANVRNVLTSFVVYEDNIMIKNLISSVLKNNSE